jgi:hypothetical protein
MANRSCSVDGIRICGGDCPWLDPPACPGYGCTPALNRVTFNQEIAGVCWADMGDAELCQSCADGEVCVQRSTSQLLCTGIDVCNALIRLGAGDACRYADKSAYTGAALATPVGPCPSTTPGALCGGACGQCPSWTYDHCTGRSFDRPWGVCPYLKLTGGTRQPDDVDSCAVDASGRWVRPCELPTILNGPYPEEEARCLVFDVAPADMEAARAWGLCSPRSVCQAAAHAAGHIHCFRSDGFDDL